MCVCCLTEQWEQSVVRICAVASPERLLLTARFLPCFRLMFRTYLWKAWGAWTSAPAAVPCSWNPLASHHRLGSWFKGDGSRVSTHRVLQRIDHTFAVELELFTGHLLQNNGKQTQHQQLHLHVCTNLISRTSLQICLIRTTTRMSSEKMKVQSCPKMTDF